MTLVSLNSLNIGAIFCKSNLVADRAASDRTLLVAIDALLRSGRVEAAISVLERELGGGC